MAEALARYDIDLFLYFTGDGPYLDVEIGKKFGLYEPRKHVTMDFVAKWASVLREYAMRYGTGVKGWWIDGCYRDFLGYTEELLTPYYEACKAGNPDCLVAMNNGVKPDFRKYYSKEEITAGEFNDFAVLPPSRFIDGAQAHILAPLGVSADGSEWGGWRRPGLKRSKEYMLDYVRRANAVGMPVTIDIFVGHDASWDAEPKSGAAIHWRTLVERQKLGRAIFFARPNFMPFTSFAPFPWRFAPSAPGFAGGGPRS